VRPSSRYDVNTLVALKLALKVPKAARIAGTIVSKVTTPEGERQITVSTPALEMVTLTVTDATRIWKRDVEATFEDLAVGDRVVSGFYDLGTMEATSLTVQPIKLARTSGDIVAINLEEPSLTIQTRVGDSVNLLISKRTIVHKDGDEKALPTDLKVGDVVVTAFYNPETQEARLLVVRSPRAATTRGSVEKVDTEGRTVTIVTREGTAVTLRVTEETRIEKDGEPGASLEDLQVNDRVPMAFYDPFTLEAIRIVAMSRAPARPEAREVMFGGILHSMEEGVWLVGRKTVLVTKDTKIEGTPKEGAPVEVKARLSADGTLTALEIQVKMPPPRKRGHP
jgi:hypothetical protein